MDSPERSANSRERSEEARWAIGVHDALAIGLGVVILIWPGISLYALTLLPEMERVASSAL